MITRLSSLALIVSLSLLGCKKKESDPKAPPSEAPIADKQPPTPIPPPPEPVAKPEPPAAPATDTIASAEDYNTRGLALFAKIIETFKAAGKDCDKLADDLTKLSTENEAFIKASHAYEAKHPDAKKNFEKVSKAMTKDFEKAAGPAMETCEDHKKLGEALAKFAE